ncbi:KH domain-containing protein [Paenibacillus sp. PR3]|jgi:Predicted RNA-binding protein (contains KH domain)|uniref:RNA-binding protein KhpA n=1 Tax=Paenibacillus terricola TaxID=2763503 RepID=A0ABR8MQF4_9BACL|nr:KH domain-containing protein [Paenibacillus terricola]MBD3918212.1 KH domain-containing protein [Paenibacillus terricola]
MKELILVIAKALVDHPNDVRVSEKEDARGNLVFGLSVNPSDVGKVIGKQGKIAKALRTVVSSAAVKSGRRITIDIDS